MIAATQPAADDEANYDHVAELRLAENGEIRPSQLKPVVTDLYKSYVARVMAAAGPTPHGFSTADHDVLKANADYLKRVRFGPLRSAIRAAGPTRKCPYCYQASAKQIDHYLPKAHFGEYAIYAPNLVPICGECNGRKLNRFQRDGGGRRYLHPYFDRLPIDSPPYIVATLSVGTSVTIAFQVVKTPGISDELWQILTTQFSDLDLAARYMLDATDTMMNMLGSFYLLFELDGAQAIRDQLVMDKRSKETWYGPNHWWPVTLGALGESAEFCEGGFRSLGPDPELMVISDTGQEYSR
ncbi:HNH endonuclease [Mycobacterium sp. ITM-2016-00318]|uniref:HNH endonuclease n=1 Tax=Mycobacterium sp. ITM-2016-00318 TaxID=2099693 RepID=UPI000CFA2DB9|nr:HNH endonuclease signature motif containing protein [Mycobacterium sp. ITM-2016-00318]WNG95005.1 HNH endonuclease signature motif containing protein [Mycobacterium sp. ITM-2016-00318]